MTDQTVGLPFDLAARGGYVHIMEAYGGSLSHHDALYYSLDFSVPKWTPVMAIASGYVVDFRESVPDGASASQVKGTADPSNGPSNIGNFVTVYYPSLHLYATYAHLAKGYVVPGPHQSFSKGDVLGYVGNTGFRTGTHLHVEMGPTTVSWVAGEIADASASHGVPALYDTATGSFSEGIVSIRDFDLSWDSTAANLYLLGNANLNGWGDQYANVLSGNRGANYLTGRGGGDELHGGAGADVLMGDSGSDKLYGDSGNDWLYGGSEKDRLYGGDGSDVLHGDAGNDILDGGAQNDWLYGDDGQDFLYGDSGNDLICGGGGPDTLYGGLGSDHFVFLSTQDSPNLVALDQIEDFNSGDKIDLSNIDANTLRSGDQGFSWIGDRPFRHVAGDLRYSGGLVQGDVNGDGAPDFSIQVHGAPHLTVFDFIL